MSMTGGTKEKDGVTANAAGLPTGCFMSSTTESEYDLLGCWTATVAVSFVRTGVRFEEADRTNSSLKLRSTKTFERIFSSVEAREKYKVYKIYGNIGFRCE
ncbi:hypothetical protein HZH68_012282 [Vespula germanica]|uniref:Uncharacterized protein n=1 Tax=Vespula germanica TaxID=30212 RepID=A0A834MXP5_VESGE|nr:hypothetical protein HZH68_012282 [Vespula germanica]